MTDVLPYFAELLGSEAPVELAFPDRFASLPCIVLSETDNSSSVILAGKERYSIISLQIDLYHSNENNVRSLALRVCSLLAEKGIKRTSSSFITDEDVPRMCIRFRFGLDALTGRIVSL